MAAVVAATISCEFPVERLAGTCAAVVVRERVSFEEAEQREEFTDAVLERRAREAEFVFRFQRERGLCGFARTVLERLLENDPSLNQRHDKFTLMLCASSRITRWKLILWSALSSL